IQPASDSVGTAPYMVELCRVARDAPSRNFMSLTQAEFRKAPGLFRDGSYGHNCGLRKRSTRNDGERLRFGFIGPPNGAGMCGSAGADARSFTLEEAVRSKCSVARSAYDFGILCSSDSCPPACGTRSWSEI